MHIAIKFRSNTFIYYPLYFSDTWKSIRVQVNVCDIQTTLCQVMKIVNVSHHDDDSQQTSRPIMAVVCK